MTWHRSGDKPLPWPMVPSLLRHACVARFRGVECSDDVNYFVNNFVIILLFMKKESLLKRKLLFCFCWYLPSFFSRFSIMRQRMLVTLYNKTYKFPFQIMVMNGKFSWYFQMGCKLLMPINVTAIWLWKMNINVSLCRVARLKSIEITSGVEACFTMW